MLLALIALVAAAQVPPRDAAALTAEDEVAAICAALKDPGGEPAPGVAPARSRGQLLARAYHVWVPANGFGLGRYREAEQELELDGGRALRALDGALTLDLSGIDDVAFRATPEQARQWAAAKKQGKLSLTVYFRPSGERCAGNAAARIFRMQGLPLWWELEVDSAPVATADEEGLPVDKPGSARGFRVDKVVLDTEMPRPDAGKDRLSGAQRALDRCAQAARRRGSLVVSFTVQDGQVHDPQVIMDAARDEDTARCVARAMSGAAISGADPSATRGTASLSVQ
ncbi:MAG: hypothetical protein ACJ79H_11115 [Myxococcales bacterium]